MESMKNLEGQNLIKDLIDTIDWRSRAWPSISFDLDADLPLPLNCSVRFQTYRVIEVYDEPKQKVCLGSPGTELEFLVIGKTNNDYEICVGTGEENFGKVYLYGFLGFDEWFSKNEYGDNDEYHQEDVCGFQKITNTIEEFSDAQYCN